MHEYFLWQLYFLDKLLQGENNKCLDPFLLKKLKQYNKAKRN